MRNGRYYGQLWVEQGDHKKTARRFPLLNDDGLAVSTLNEAKEALEIKRHDRRENVLPSAGRKPMLFAFIETYFAKAEIARKKPGTIQNEKQALERWKMHLGDIRVDRIKTPMIATYKDKRLRKGLSPRTVNLDIIALRNVLKWAVEDGHLCDMPKAKTLKAPKPDKRRLLTPEEFESLLAAVPNACEKNAAQFADYLQFLAYSGAREQEALRVRWALTELALRRAGVELDDGLPRHVMTTADVHRAQPAALPVAPRRHRRCARVVQEFVERQRRECLERNLLRSL